MDKEIIHKELDLIQDIIKRMTQNSFQVKGWLIALLSAIVVFEKDNIILSGGDDTNTAIWLNILLFLPIICFWYLDSFFLSTEKRYREVYKWVVKNRKYTEAYLYDLNTMQRENNGVTENLDKASNRIFKVCFSPTILLFYIIPLIFVISLLIYNFQKC